jgi:phage terminase large subunit-like protein
MDLRPANNVLAFAERVLGVVPHRMQAEFLLDDHPVRVLISGRRGGKSTALSIWASWNAVRHRLGGPEGRDGRSFEILTLCPAIDQARILIGYVASMLRASPLGGLIEREVNAPFPEIHLGGGVAIRARATTDRAKNVRGRGADAILIDEAAYLPPQVIQEVAAPMLADRGGTLLLCSTPSDLGSYLHGLYERGQTGRDPRVKSWTFPSSANPHLNQAYIEAQRAELTSSQWANEYEGHFIDPSARVFRWEDVAACIQPPGVRASEPRRGDHVVVALDPAKIHDASALLVLDVSALPYRVLETRDLGGRDYGAQVEAVARLARMYGDPKVVVDATGGAGQVIVDLLRRAGVWAVGVSMTATRQEQMFTELALLFERRQIRIPDDPRLVAELRWFCAKRTPSGHIKYEGDRGRDDFVDALALAVNGAGGLDADRARPMMQASLTEPWHEGELGTMSAEDEDRLDALRSIAPPGTIELGSDGFPTGIGGWHDAW